MGGPPTVYGVAVCACIRDSLPVLESRLRAAGLISRDLSGLITQGSYSLEVAASAGTHAGGGVLDLRDWTDRRADLDRIMTGTGWLDFYRPRGILYPDSPPHHHVVLYGCPHLSPAASTQVVDALAGRNGLASHAVDLGPRPSTTWQDALEQATTTRPEEDMTMRFSCQGTVYLASVATGAYYAIPNEEYDGLIIGLPGVVTLGELNPRQRDLIRDTCNRAMLSANPAAAPIVATLDPAQIAAALDAAGLAAAVVDQIGRLLSPTK